tara:strand:+ start:1319 stop:1624 length:306 start_codon:yes stop_codon:yes gene_type:complete
MRLIAHRGNLNGPNPLVENDPQRITYCIDEGYDVEIDVRYDHHTNMLWLGHDEPNIKLIGFGLLVVETVYGFIVKMLQLYMSFLLRLVDIIFSFMTKMITP